MTEIADEVLRALFDVAVSSMDFGSGFLDDEEVAQLRQAAKVLGVDPMEATPQNFWCKYRGHHAASVYLDTPYFHDLAGTPRNAYRLRSEFPPGIRLEGAKPGDDLGCYRAKVLSMFCPDCGRRWGALDPVPGLA